MLMGCNEQMFRRHVRRCLGTKNEIQHRVVASVGKIFRFESHMVVFLVVKMKPDLPESKLIDVVDDKRGEQRRSA